MGFSRQEYWSGLPFPSPGDLPNPGIEPRSLALQADFLPSEPPGKTYVMYILAPIFVVVVVFFRDRMNQAILLHRYIHRNYKENPSERPRSAGKDRLWRIQGRRVTPQS